MSPFVTPSWLADRLQDADVVVLDATLPPVGVSPPADTRGRYLAKHIPGAVFFDIDELSDHSSGLPHTLPTAESFGRSMAALGVGDGMTIVVYEQEGVFSAPRARWMLRVFGAREVYLLDGGLKAWVEAGFATEAGAVSRAAASFAAKLDDAAVKSFGEVQRLLAEGAQVVDARSAGRFSGAAPEPRAGLSSGHMPGSISLPFTELVEDGRFKDAEALRQIFAAKRIDVEEAVTTSCGSGVTAAVIATGLEVVGAKWVSLYDGSWAEYAQQADAVIEKD
jgi:thiosulfate/3-mercaptopyruvate sulfurtransferase